MQISSSNTNTPIIKLELANSIIHGIGVLFSIAAMPPLAIIAYETHNTTKLLVAAVYAFSFLMVFSFSTLFHAFQQPLVKEFFKILDHISIFFFIAGTYTPLVYCYFYNPQGILMLQVLWILTVLGIFFKIYFVNRFHLVSVLIYFMMGWLLIWTGNAFFSSMPSTVVSLILFGNLLYTIGLIFYLWRRWVYHHAYWHTLVLVAAICHYASVLIALKNSAA